MYKLISTIFILFGICNSNIGQPCPVWIPCNSNGIASCACTTAPLLCSFNCLQEYKFTMGSRGVAPVGNPDICPGLINTAWQNPTWLRILAPCENFSVNLSFSDCTGSGLSRGIQTAIYSQCDNINSVVACDSEFIFPCGDPNPPCYGCGVAFGTRSLNVTGAVPGKIYYLVIDGCGGSRCNIVLNVLPNNCVIQNNFSIIGPDTVVTQNEYLYKFEFPVGTKFLTIIQDSIIKQVVTSDTSTSYLYKTKFNNKELSNLCVKSESICGSDSTLCKKITLLKPNAGIINYLNNYFCPTDSIMISIDSTQKYKEFKNYIVLSDTSGIVKHITDQTNFKILNKTCEKYDVYSFNTLKIDTSSVKIGDSIHHIIKKCDSSVCDYSKKVLNLKELNLPPNFINPPVDITLNCPMGLENTSIPLSYSNNLPPGPCLVSGAVNSENTTLIDDCNGVYKKAWKFSNVCHTIEHSQLISISSTEAKFINPPKDTTVICEDFDFNFLPSLFYNNTVLGLCNISGSVTATATYNIIDCSGYTIRTWEYTEPCGRILKHTQKINVVKTSGTTDIEESLILKSSVYTKTLFLELINNKGYKRFKVTNIEGRDVYSGEIESKMEIDISSLHSGLYFIFVNGKNQTYTSKIFVP